MKSQQFLAFSQTQVRIDLEFNQTQFGTTLEFNLELDWDSVRIY